MKKLVIVSMFALLFVWLTTPTALAADNFLKIVSPVSTGALSAYATVTKPKLDIVVNYSYPDAKTRKLSTVTIALMISDNRAQKQITEVYKTGGESGTVTFAVDFSQPPFNVTNVYHINAYIKEAGWNTYIPAVGDAMTISYEPAPPSPSPTPKATASVTPRAVPTASPTPAASKPTIVSFYSDPGEIKAGQKVTLRWQVTGADSVIVDGLPGWPLQGSMVLTPTEAHPMAQITTPGATPLLWHAYTIKATNSVNKTETSSQILVGIQPLTLDEIYDAYVAWGNQPHSWPDGTQDSKALVGPGWSGGTNNLSETVTRISGIGSFEGVRWDCNAMQYRSLVFLNEMKQAGKLSGWDYMGVEGAAIATTGVYPNHKAAAIWRTDDDWRKTATILDPHDKQEPDKYPVTAGLDSIAPWEPDSDYYGDVYPGVPNRSAAATGKYRLDVFDANGGNRWGNGTGAKTPWENQKTIPKQVKDAATDYIDNIPVPDDPTARMVLGIYCPVDVVITNSAGRRLGRLGNGTMVTEFKPLKAYYEADPRGDKQWVFTLPRDTYTVSIVGAGSGKFRLLTYSGGKSLNDFGENPIARGQQAVLSLKPGAAGELTLADGSRITSRAVQVESLLRSGGQSTFNFIPVAIGLAAVIVIVLIFSASIRKRAVRTRVADTVAVPRQEAPLPIPAQGQPAAPRVVASLPQVFVCAKCGYQNPAPIRFCTRCGAERAAPTASPTLNFCPKCGDPVKGEKFCDKCGTKLDWVTS